MERVTLPNASTAEIVSGGRPLTRLENRRDSSARRFWKSLIRVVRDTRPTPPIRSLFYKRRDAKKRMSADIQPVQTRSGLSPLPSRPDTLVFWPRSTGRCQGETKPRSIRDTIYAKRPRAPPSFSDRSMEARVFTDAPSIGSRSSNSPGILRPDHCRLIDRYYFFLSVFIGKMGEGEFKLDTDISTLNSHSGTIQTRLDIIR